MSDHFSGPRAIAGPAGDITDLYVFPSPERPGHLVLVLDVLPDAPLDSYFSDAIVYRFRLRRVTISGVGAAQPFPSPARTKRWSSAATSRLRGKAEPEWRRCRKAGVRRRRVRRHASAFTRRRARAAMACASMPASERNHSSSMCRRLIESQKTGRLAFKEVGTNAAIGFNVLSIVIEADCRPWLRERQWATASGGRRDGGRRQAPDPDRADRPPRDQERDLAVEAV